MALSSAHGIKARPPCTSKRSPDERCAPISTQSPIQSPLSADLPHLAFLIRRPLARAAHERTSRAHRAHNYLIFLSRDIRTHLSKCGRFRERGPPENDFPPNRNRPPNLEVRLRPGEAGVSWAFGWTRSTGENSRCGMNGGGRGIRTLGTRKGTTVFETAPFNHSGIPPRHEAPVIYSPADGAARDRRVAARPGQAGSRALRRIALRR